MRVLLDSHFYSVLYFNSVIWLTPEITTPMKQSLLSISANALRCCIEFGNVSFDNVLKICAKCTPSQIMMYQAALKLHKITTSIFEEEITTENVRVLNQMVSTSRQASFQTVTVELV